MSVILTTCRRTLSMALAMHSTAIAMSGFCAVVSVMFALGLESSAVPLSMAATWSLAASRALPFLAAVLAMDTWSGELRSGRIELLLSTSAKERDLTIGKFAGVVILVSVAVVLSSLISLCSAVWSLPRPGVYELVGALALLLVQSLAWSAVSVFASAIFRNGAIAALFSLVLSCVLPRAIWIALIAWAPQERLAMGRMPFDAHAVDFASGNVSIGNVIVYLIIVAIALFIASKSIAFRRLSGRGSRGLRVSTVFSMFLAVVAGALASLLAIKVSPDFVIFSSADRIGLSSRTVDIVGDADCKISITCFLPRNSPGFARVSSVLESIAKIGNRMGRRLTLQFVDPKWDIAAAERLVRGGFKEDCVIVENARRRVVLKPENGFDESRVASAIKRVVLPLNRHNVYWTVGHGEFSCGDYDSWGLSDIARDIGYDGYHNCTIDLSSESVVPEDCAAVIIAGAKEDFSRIELDRLEAYLRGGGRLLVLLERSLRDGLVSLLSSWGIRPVVAAMNNAPTISGSDVVVTEFTGHEISDRFAGSRIVLDRPFAFLPSASADSAGAVSRIDFHSVALVGTSSVVAASERGGAAGGDLALRPTRIVAIGDASMMVNCQLRSRGHANRDFILNCIDYLSGNDTFGGCNDVGDSPFVSVDRSVKRRILGFSCAVLPLLVYLLMTAVVLRRRHRR